MKACVITGASSGIGLELANRFLKRGFKVYGLSREPDKAPIKDQSNYEPIACDLRNREDILRASRRVLEGEKRVKVLINNAGVGHFGHHDSLTPIQIEEMINVNLLAPFLLTRLFLGTLRANRGHVVFISSVAGTAPSPMGAVYGATKAGLSHFAKSIFEENRRAGLKVHTIIPDITNTAFFDSLSFGPFIKDPASYLEPGDVADAVEFACFSREPVVVQEIVIKPQVFKIEKRP